MPTPRRGEVWLVDLGMVAMVRSRLALSIATGPHDRVLVTLVPHTTSTRGSQFEADVPAPFLRSGAFDAQGLIKVPHATLIRRLGSLPSDQLAVVEDAVRRWLGL